MSNILIVTGKMQQGGAEKVLSILSNRWADQGHSVTIMTLLASGSFYDLNSDVKLVSLGGASIYRFLNIPHWMKGIRAEVKERKVDVVLSFFSKINVLSLVATIGLHTRIVVSERNDPQFDGRNCVVALCTKLFYRLADLIVFQTTRAQTQFPKFIQKKSEVVLNPIQIEVQPIPISQHNHNKIVNVGRLHPQKNHELLLRAFARLTKLYKDVFLEIYGEGPYEEKIRDSVVKLGLQDKVRICGAVTDVHAKIADAACFVLSSDYEGLSNALMEAMALGLPCVTTSCAGSNDLIINGVSGLIVPTGNEDSLYQAIKEIYENRGLAERLSRQALSTSQRFRSENVAAQWDEAVFGKGPDGNGE